MLVKLNDRSVSAQTIIEEFLQENNGDINARDVKGNALLHHAAQCKRIDVVRELCKRDDLNIDAQNEQGQTFLHLAAALKDSVSFLLDLFVALKHSGKKPNPNLCDAQQRTSFGIVIQDSWSFLCIENFLIFLGADYRLPLGNGDATSILDYAITKKLYIYWFMLRAAILKDTETFKLLWEVLNKEFSVLKLAQFLLTECAKHKSIELANYIIESEPFTALEKKEIDIINCLFAAAEHNNFAFVKLLLQTDFTIPEHVWTKKDFEQNTVASIAARFNSVEFMLAALQEKVLSREYIQTTRNRWGDSPLLIAARNNCIEFVEMLLQQGVATLKDLQTQKEVQALKPFANGWRERNVLELFIPEDDSMFKDDDAYHSCMKDVVVSFQRLLKYPEFKSIQQKIDFLGCVRRESSMYAPAILDQVLDSLSNEADKKLMPNKTQKVYRGFFNNIVNLTSSQVVESSNSEVSKLCT